MSTFLSGAGWLLLGLLCVGVLRAVFIIAKRRIQYAYFGGPHPSTYPDEQTPPPHGEPSKYYPSLSRTAYGTLLATQVTDFLQEVDSIRYFHRDYCGVGFYHEAGTFYYDEVYDGEFVTQLGYSGEKPLAAYAREPFIAWLSTQSDESLCGRSTKVDGFTIYNQRITKKRLLAVLQSRVGSAG